MMRILIGLAAGLLLTTAAGAEEIWQTLPQPPAMPTPRENGMAPVDDIQMYYAIYGKGDPVLLIHGGIGNSGEFGFLVPALAEDHEVIAAAARARTSPSATPLWPTTSSPCSTIWGSTRWRWSAGATALSSGSTSRSAIPSG